jgi:hypothetical protein
MSGQNSEISSPYKSEEHVSDLFSGEESEIEAPKPREDVLKEIKYSRNTADFDLPSLREPNKYDLPPQFSIVKKINIIEELKEPEKPRKYFPVSFKNRSFTSFGLRDKIKEESDDSGLDSSSDSCGEPKKKGRKPKAGPPEIGKDEIVPNKASEVYLKIEI